MSYHLDVKSSSPNGNDYTLSFCFNDDDRGFKKMLDFLLQIQLNSNEYLEYEILHI